MLTVTLICQTLSSTQRGAHTSEQSLTVLKIFNDVSYCMFAALIGGHRVSMSTFYFLVSL